MLVASLTTSNEAWGRNPHVPKGFVAARGRPRRCRSSAMTHIAVVAAPRGRPRGATNATHAITRTHSWGRMGAVFPNGTAFSDDLHGGVLMPDRIRIRFGEAM